jgi:hypothetical protein
MIFKTNSGFFTTSWLHQAGAFWWCRKKHYIITTTFANILVLTGFSFFKIVYLLQTVHQVP